jgi:TP901 family phage tail tape measure protein
MASFNLTAELNLRGPSNLNQVVSNIRRQLSTLTLDLNINPATSRGVQAVTADVRNLSAALRDAQTNAVALGGALRGLGASVSNLASSASNLNTNLTGISRSATGTGTAIRAASSEMSEFGRQSALAIRRFAAFSVATGAIYALGRAITSAYGEFMTFNKEFVRLQQVTDSTATGLQSLSNEITKLSTSLGVGSQELLQVSVTLAQAGLSAGETKTALEALAKSALAPSFDSLNDTVEGSIALMRQFGISASDLEGSLGSINAVAAKFAVEAGDIITAIQRTGGVFANASKGVSQGKDALNEFLAVFTSVRATTRESAETIATGLRTIFTRIQRGGTIDALKQYGIELTDLEGKFVGPYEAVRRLSEGLKTLDPRDLRFSQIVEELGGFRQIGKVIPLIQQFETAQKALGVAQRGSGSLAADAATAQEALSVRINKVREQFIALIRDIGQSQGFQTFVDVSLKLASALISVADAAKDVLPAIAAITAIRGVGALGQFFSGFSGGIGRRPRGFATGGRVPGSGSGDTVPAMLTPGEFVIRKRAVDAIGAGNLHRMNKYASGGRVKRFARGGIANAPMIDDILQTTGSVLPKPSAVEALIKAGGGAVDIDRTLKRTIGDKAYGKASSSGAQKGVLDKFFTDEAARLQDVKSSPLTGFGKALQEAIKSGQLKGSRVSIISKSRRTKGVPEYLSQLFGIPVQNMVFTQGGTKQPAIDAIRSKGPRIERVGRFAAGGLIQKFALGGMAQDLKEGWDRRLGAAILEYKPGSEEQQSKGSISAMKLTKDLGATDLLEKGTNKSFFPNKNISFSEIYEGLSENANRVFQETIDKQIVRSVNVATAVIAKKIGVQSARIDSSSAQNFLSGINKGTRGNLFEEIVFNLNNANAALTKTREGADAPFDFPVFAGLGGGTEYTKLPRKWVDAKASFARAKRDGGLTQKAYNQLKTDLAMGVASGDLIKAQTAAQIQTASIGTTVRTEQLAAGSIKRLLAEGKIKNAGTKKYEVLSPLEEADMARFATGGSIKGEDTVPALLTPGEFVINKKAAKRIGGAQLNRLNKADKIQGFNTGGVVQKFAGGGSTLPARPGTATGFNVVVPNSTIDALRNMGDALESLGVSASASAQLIEKGGAISVRASERAYESDLTTLRIAGASATDIYNAEQNLGRIRQENARKIDTSRELSGFGGERLQDIQTRAEAERQRITQGLRNRGATEEEIAANQGRIRGRAFENVTAAEMGTTRRGLRARGMSGESIEQYVNQSMLDTRTLRQMNNQLRQTREQELRNSAAYTSASAAEQNRMMRELRTRNNEEISERKSIARQLRAERGLGGGTFGRVRNTLQTAGSLVGMGDMREDAFGAGPRGTRFARGWNTATQATQRAGFGLTFAGGLIGDTLGKMRGGKEGEALSAGISTFVGTAGIGMMFGPIGALTGVIVGATSAMKAYTQSIIDSTIAEESQKVEGATLKLQKAFEKLDKATNRSDIQGGIKSAAQELGQVASSESRKQNAITDKAISEKGMLDTAPNMARIEKELVASARQTNILQSLPQIFEQGMAKGLTISQIQASFPPGELDRLKEIFATASGDTVISGLVAKREEMQARGARPEDIAVIDEAIKRMSSALVGKDILKPLMDRKKVEDAMAAAAAAATVKVNLLAEVLKGISAAASKAGASFEETQRQIAITAGSAFGETFKVQGPNRQQENILDNIQAYSTNEIRNIVGQIGQQFKFNPALTREAQGAAVNQRILGEELPKILADIAAREGQGFDPEGAPANVIRKQLDEVFKTAIPDAGTRGETVQRLVDKIGERLRSRQGITVEELAGDEKALADIMKMDADTLKVFNDLLKQSNNIIAELNNSINNWSTQMSQAIQGRIESQNIGINADNELSRALGKELNLADMNAVFENTIRGLTQRIGAGGKPIAGTGTLDPGVILQRQLEKEQEARDIQKQLETEKPPVDSARYKALDEALRRSTLEARNLAAAHQKLQSDSSRAANALTKIGELRQLQDTRQTSFLDLLKNINNPEAMMQFTNEVQSFFAQMAGQGTMENLPAAIAGLERQIAVLPAEQGQAIREDFIRSLQGMTGLDANVLQSIIDNIGAGPQTSPEMQGLINEFYKYTNVQQTAVEQAAQRTIEAANIAHDQLVAGATTARNIISAAGQQNPVQVQQAGKKSRGGIIYASKGQYVNYEPKGTDTVPAMLTPGEFVVNAKATKKHRGLLQSINSNSKAGGYSSGGMVYLAGGGYVPKDTTIEADAAKIQAEMEAINAEIDKQIAAVNAILEPLVQQHASIPEGPQNDTQRRALWEQMQPLYAQRDGLSAKRAEVYSAFQPQLNEIQQRRSLEADRKTAATGELSPQQAQELNTQNIPGATLSYRFLKAGYTEEQMTPEEKKQYAEYKAEVEKRKQARIDQAKNSVAAADQKEAQQQQQGQPGQQQRTGAQVQQQMQQAGGMRMTKEQRKQRNEEIKANIAQEKERRRQAFLDANPYYKKKEEEKATKQQKELQDAQRWFIKQNTKDDGSWGGPVDRQTGKGQMPDDVVRQHKKAQAQERSQANRERILFGAPVNPLDPKAKEKKDEAAAMGQQKIAEQLKVRRGEELARRYGWTLPDTKPNGTVIGRYEGYEPGEEPFELRKLSAEDRAALDAHQMSRLATKEKAARDRMEAEAKVKSAAEWEASKAQIAAQVKAESDKKTLADKARQEKEKEKERVFKQKLADEEIVFQSSVAARRKAEAEKEQERLSQAKTERERKKQEEAISLAENDPRSTRTEGLSPDDQEEAKRLGISEQQLAFNQSVDKFNAQLNDPSLIQAETDAISQKLRDLANARRMDADNLEKEKAGQGWFSSLKESLTLSDPYTPQITDARNKAAAADQLLSQLGSTTGLSRKEKIALNNRVSSGYEALIRRSPGEGQLFQDMMDIENNAIDLTRDAVIDVGTSVIPAGGAIKAARGTTKAASLAYRAGQAARAGAKAGAISGGVKGVVVGTEEGSATKALAETAKGAVVGAVAGAAMPALGAVAGKATKATGSALTAALPQGVTKAGKTVLDKTGKVLNADFTGAVRKKLAEDDARAAAQFAAWQKAEAARQKLASAQKARPAPSAGLKAQSDWLKKNAPLAERSAEELGDAVTRGQEMASRFQQMGLETPNFGTTSAATTAATKTATTTTKVSVSTQGQAFKRPLMDYDNIPGETSGGRYDPIAGLQDDAPKIVQTKPTTATTAKPASGSKTSVLEQIGKTLSGAGSLTKTGVGKIFGGTKNVSGSIKAPKATTAPTKSPTVQPQQVSSPQVAINRAQTASSNPRPVTSATKTQTNTPDRPKVVVPPKKLTEAERIRMSGETKVGGSATANPTAEAPIPAVQAAAQPKPQVSSRSTEDILREDYGADEDYINFLRGGKNPNPNWAGTLRPQGEYLESLINQTTRTIESYDAEIAKIMGQKNFDQRMVDNLLQGKSANQQQLDDMMKGEYISTASNYLRKKTKQIVPETKALGGLIYASKGTLVPYQPRGTDTVPAMLTPGEFVVNRKSAKQNMGLLKAINNGHNVKPIGFNRGGIVPTQYYAEAGSVSGGSGGGGVSNIGVDTSSLDASFSTFSNAVGTLSSVMDTFTQSASNLSGFSQAIGSLGNLGLREGASLMANAGISVKEATTAFGTAMTAFNTSATTLATAIGAIPKSISLTVSGSIPVTVSVQIEGGTGGGVDTAQLEQSIMDKVALAINSATQGGISIDTATA